MVKIAKYSYFLHFNYIAGDALTISSVLPKKKKTSNSEVYFVNRTYFAVLNPIHVVSSHL
jgi:hypothetical protein